MNEPIVYGLEDRFGDDIVFIRLDVDDRETLPLREAYALVQRSRYLLLSPSGETVNLWIGALPEGNLIRTVRDYLNTLESNN